MDKEKILDKMTEYTKKYYMITLRGCIAWQILYLISALLFKQSILWLHIIPLIVFILSTIIFKEFANDKELKTTKKLIPKSIVIGICGVLNHMIICVANGFTSVSKTNSFCKLSYLIDFFIVIIALVEIKKETVIKESIEEFMTTSFLMKLGVLDKNIKLKPGDVQICVNEETSEPVILPKNDRFLHMLVLGPTGCGKTSQVLIPMINQDVQNMDCGVTVIEPKGDLAEKIFMMAKHYGREVMYFNPILPDCPYFNPLFGKEEDVIENMATTFKMLNPDSAQFFQDMNEQLIRHSLKVLKRLYGNNATLIDLATLVQNSGGEGRKIVTQFSRLNVESPAIAKENADTASWFLNDYFNEKSKTYDNCSGVRSQISKIISNKYLRRVLNPPNGQNDIDFDKHLAEGGVVVMTTAQGKLRDLGRFLGYFIILQLQSAVFRRPGDEDTRKAHFLYIDEFQVYSNPGFADMLTQGRSYRVASHLATQNRALMAMGGGNDGKNFVELVSTNARNTIIFPGGNAADAKYYSEQFGEVLVKKTELGTSNSRFGTKLQDKVTKRYSEKNESRYSSTDLIYRKFGHLTYSLINNNSLQPAGQGIVEYIPKELNNKLKNMLSEYKESLKEKYGYVEDEIEIPSSTDKDKNMNNIEKKVNNKEETSTKNIELSSTNEVPDLITTNTGMNNDFKILTKSNKKDKHVVEDDDFFDDKIVEDDNFDDYDEINDELEDENINIEPINEDDIDEAI